MNASSFHGVVLAGGRSSRMGTDKASLRWRGQSMLEAMGDVLQAAGATRVLVSGPYPGADALPDTEVGLGPLGGVLALAQAEPDGVYVLVPVDMPRLSAALLRPLALALGSRPERRSAAWLGYPLPLGLRLDDGVRDIVAGLARGPAALRSLRGLHVRLGGIDLVLPADATPDLVNCNTPEAWRRVTA